MVETDVASGGGGAVGPTAAVTSRWHGGGDGYGEVEAGKPWRNDGETRQSDVAATNAAHLLAWAHRTLTAKTWRRLENLEAANRATQLARPPSPRSRKAPPGAAAEGHRFSNEVTAQEKAESWQ